MSELNLPYADLTPDRVMDAVESLGYLCDARVLALNSYENRVYQVGIEDQAPLIAKFYRPQRWSNAAIREEHAFLLQLADEEVPVVAPLQQQGETLFECQGYRFALFPQRGGHAPELSNEHDLETIGRWLARIHQVGSRATFSARRILQPLEDLTEAHQQVLDSGLMPEDYRPAYDSTMTALAQRLSNPEWQTLRLHGDLHNGNLLLRYDELFFVDFDDCLQGPAIQDIWMLLSGQRDEQQSQLQAIARGYEVFRSFPAHELQHIELLRTLRIARYAAWLCQRWQDPAFPLAFPWFTGHQFWSQHLLSLREQQASLDDEPLTLFA
ncbi:serine/threonine protein kinase [Bacterioplanes sanyensis]|uniref:serine/threonine protein kinase n=1 Tax=Bacterioplanes sanyensis TaxID=1249553 RepID=UPI001673A3D6|nr:serine/threonine protein kinase [Bacterioplanes sanyensis]